MLIMLTGGFLEPSLCPDVSEWLIGNWEFPLRTTTYVRPVVEITTPEELFEFMNLLDNIDYSIDIHKYLRTSVDGIDVEYAATIDYTGY